MHQLIFASYLFDTDKDMDIEITKKHPRLRKAAPWVAGGVVVAALAVWALVGTMTSTYRTERKGLATGEVVEGEFDDFVRLNGRVESGTVVQVCLLYTSPSPRDS